MDGTNARHEHALGAREATVPPTAPAAPPSGDDCGGPRGDHAKRQSAEHHVDRAPHSDHGGRGHGGHSHAISANANQRYLWTAFGLIVAFMAAEVVVGLVIGSLVLLADAAHMVSDAGAIGLTLFAMRLARRPARGAYTYGLKRAEILSALANGGALLGLGLFFVIEALTRLVAPSTVDGLPVLV
ncbi:MAG TPA: cation diffusion facilitator family transporter, partial [Pseudonocardiaceae bacterium]|nr:cation diffusion facilitator family transporter [Pseudonocardiaceae bacterium]